MLCNSSRNGYFCKILVMPSSKNKCWCKVYVETVFKKNRIAELKNASLIALWQFLILFLILNLKSSTLKLRVQKSHAGFWDCNPIACVDPWTVAKALRWLCQQHTQAFQIYSTLKDLFLLRLGCSIPSKEVAFIDWGFAGRSVWICVLVAWLCRPISAITTGNDWLFSLKSQQSFSLFLLSLENPPPFQSTPHTFTHVNTNPCTLLMLCTRPLLPCHQMPVRMQNKYLLA